MNSFLKLSLLAVATSALGFSTTINIVNPSFETDTITPSGYVGSSPTGWTTSGISGYWYTEGSGYFPPAPDGHNILYLAYGSPGTASQALTDSLAPNTNYSLSFYVATRADLGPADYQVALYSGSNVLASNSASNTSIDNFLLRNVTFNSGSSNLGNLHLEASAGSGQVGFDAFSLQSTDAPTGTPEPGTYAMMLGAAVGLLVLKRR